MSRTQRDRVALVYIPDTRPRTPTPELVVPHRTRPHLPPAPLLRGGDAGARLRNAALGGAARAGRARLPVLRAARRGEDHARARPGDGAQLPEPHARMASRAASAIPASGSGRARPRSTWWRSTRPPTAASTTRATCASARCTRPSERRPLQGLHHRRGAHAHARGVECAAQDPGGAAAARDLRLRHHGAAEDPAGRAADPVALPALRFPPHRHGRPACAGCARCSPPRASRAGDDVLLPIAQKADGGMRDALSLLDQVLSFTEGASDRRRRAARPRAGRRRAVPGADRTSSPSARHADVFRFVARLLDEGYDLAEFYRGLARLPPRAAHREAGRREAAEMRERPARRVRRDARTASRRAICCACSRRSRSSTPMAASGRAASSGS